MAGISVELTRIEAAGLPVFWLGPCSNAVVSRLETQLGLLLPATFREFLMTTGGGEVAASVLSGVESGDPSLEHAGTVWGDTVRCRQEFGLPSHLIVVYFAEEEICWCLDSRGRDSAGECPVVSYSIHRRVVEKELASDFGEFLRELIDGKLERR